MALAALAFTGCKSGQHGSFGDTARTEKDFGSVAAYVRSEAQRSSGCTNGDTVVDSIDAHLKQNPNQNIEFVATLNHEFNFESVVLGPSQKGLLVRLWTGAASGNSKYFLYRAKAQKLKFVGVFSAETIKFLEDHVTNGMYDVYTTWHMSQAGGPFDYHRWTGTAYEVYKSGDTQTTGR